MHYYHDFIIEVKENKVTSTYNGTPNNAPITISNALKAAFEPNPQTGEQKPLDLTEDQTKDLGNTLFSTLFQGEVLKQFQEAVEATNNSCGPDGSPVGLRILLRTEAYASYPWEMMRNGEGDYLATDVRTPLVRVFPGSNRAINIRDKQPKIIVILSQVVKKGLNAINTDTEWKNIEDALKDNPEVGKPEKVEVPPTRIRIMKKMREISKAGTPCNIIHFVGHGNFEDDTGYLLLPLDDDCSEDKIDQDKVRNLFLNEESLGLVVLNSCNTARIVQFSGLVPRLLSRIPAVIAMCQPISNHAAVSFASGFYKWLMGIRIEETIQRARQEMLLNPKCKPIEFSIPVLYLGWRNNQTVRTIFTKFIETKQEAPLQPLIAKEAPVLFPPNVAKAKYEIPLKTATVNAQEIVQDLTTLAKLFGDLEKIMVSMIDLEPTELVLLAGVPWTWEGPIRDLKNKCEEITSNLCQIYPAKQEAATQHCSDLKTELKNLKTSIRKGSHQELKATWNRTKAKCQGLIESFSEICTQTGGP